MQVVATKLRVYNSDVTSSCREYDCSDAQLNDSDRELMSTLARKPGHDLKKGCVSIAWMTKDMSDVRHLYASLSAQSQNLRFDKDTIKTLSNAWECDGDVSGVFIPIRTGPYRHILAIPATCICDSEIRGALMHAGCQGDDGQVCGVKLTLMEKEKKRTSVVVGRPSSASQMGANIVCAYLQVITCVFSRRRLPCCLQSKTPTTTH